MSHLPVFVVSLVDSSRRLNILKELENIEFEFIDAVLGKKLESKFIEDINNSQWVKDRYNRKLGLGEIGCSLSHRKIYKKMIDEDIQWAVVFEDDIYLKYNFFNELKDKMKYFSDDDIYILGAQEGSQCSDYVLFSKKHFIKFNNDFEIRKTVKSEKYIYSTAAYIISKKTAKKIYDYTMGNFCCADDWWEFKEKKIINNIYLGNMVGHPEVADEQSLLQNERLLNAVKSWKDDFKFVYKTLRFIKINLRKIFISRY